MNRGPLTKEENDLLAKINDLADQIYAAAAPLDKYPRHPLSNAAKLIQWIAYEYQNRGDAEALEAIAKLRAALDKPS